MAKNNAIDNKSQELTIDPGASGDSWVQFDINATNKFKIGVDDTAADGFKVSQGSALGTNDTFIMTADGERTMPLQPAFLGILETTDSNVTGDATLFVIGSGNALTEIFDQGSDFTTAGVFTAPIDGIYHFFFWLTYAGLTASHTDGLIIVRAGGISYFGANLGSAAIRNVSDTVALSFDIIVPLDASDTATFEMRMQNGAKVVDIVGSSTAVTGFAGFLIT